MFISDFLGRFKTNKQNEIDAEVFGPDIDARLCVSCVSVIYSALGNKIAILSCM